MRLFTLYAAATLGFIGSAHAVPVNLQISLTDPVLAGAPGSTEEWTATLSDPIDLAAGNSILITGSQFDDPCQGCVPPPASVGTYTDLAGLAFVVLAPSGNCCGDPQSVSGEPIGTFTFSSARLPGPVSGFLEIDYAIFSGDPNDPSFNPDTQTVAPDVRAFVPVAVEPVPEPASLLLVFIGAAAVLVPRRLGLRQ
jgi:hypothetical protein